MSEKWKRILMAFVGVSLTGVSVGFFNYISLGPDPFTVLVNGIASLFGSTYGVFYMVVTGVLFVVVLFLDRHYIGIATLFNLFGIGIIADFVLGILKKVLGEQPLQMRLLLLAFTLVLLCFASSLYMTAQLGVSTYDALSLIMAEKKLASFRVCRIGTDLTCILVGVLCHSVVGIGTVLTAFGMGPIIHLFLIHVSTPLLHGRKKNVEETV